MPQLAWRRGGDLLWEERTAQPPGIAPTAWPCTSCWEPSVQPQLGQSKTGGCLFAESAQLGKGLIQVPQGCPHKLMEGGGHRQVGGTLDSCLRQHGPGQQCRSQAPGERPPPAHRCQSNAPHSESPAQKRQGSGAGKTLLRWDPLSTACLEKPWAQLEKARSEKPFLELAHQVLTCLAPGPAAQSCAAPMNAVFLLPAAQPLAAPQLLRLGREKSQGLFFCPLPLARLCTALRAQAGASAADPWSHRDPRGAFTSNQ